jgi:D-alanyl-D-alanine carboxypeptidase
MREPQYRRMVAMRSVTLPAYKKRASRTFKSTNHLLGKYKGMLGGKTGFTDNAGYSLVASAERNGITLTTVVLGTRGENARFKNTDRLLDWGFKHLKLQRVATATETVAAVPVAANHSRTVPARFAETTSAVVFDLDGPVARAVTLPDNISLPVYEGQVIGHAELKQGDRIVTDVPLVAAADIASAAETVGAVPVADYLERTVPVRAADASVAVPAFAADKPVERTVTLEERVSAPVAAGDRLGQVVYSQNGRTIVTVPVVAAASIEAPGALGRVGIWFARTWRGLLGKPTMAKLQVDG